MASISLYLVDDHMLFRKGVSALLAQESDFLVKAELDSGKDVLLRSPASEPDIVVMDIRLGGLAGLDVVGQIKRRMGQTRVVLLTTIRTEEYVRAALMAGIDGYVLKDASLEELLMALRCVARGKKYLSPDVSGNVVESFLHPEQAAGKRSGTELLTNRERGVLQLIGEGRTNRSVAEALFVSPKTVEKYRATLMQKLGLQNATELILAAMALGLVERPAAIARLLGNVCGACDALPLSGNGPGDNLVPIKQYVRAS